MSAALPLAAQVTPAMLHDLYGGELPAASVPPEEIPPAPRTVAMNCR